MPDTWPCCEHCNHDDVDGAQHDEPCERCWPDEPGAATSAWEHHYGS